MGADRKVPTNEGVFAVGWKEEVGIYGRVCNDLNAHFGRMAWRGEQVCSPVMVIWKLTVSAILAGTMKSHGKAVVSNSAKNCAFSQFGLPSGAG